FRALGRTRETAAMPFLVFHPRVAIPYKNAGNKKTLPPPGGVSWLAMHAAGHRGCTSGFAGFGLSAGPPSASVRTPEFPQPRMLTRPLQIPISATVSTP